ncbi:MAG: MerR family transcriptional regulator [Deltaproteobacteria bacterium]|nr:MerR family transcriptional regulator [Deltaproteobacteria bacterium]
MGNLLDSFNVRAVERIAGLTHRQLTHWDKTGLIKPSVQPATGRGSRRLYSFEDLVDLRVVATLRESGVSLQAIRKTVAYLRKHHSALHRPLASLTLVTDGKRIFALTDDPDTLIDITSRGQLTFAIAVGRIVLNLREKLTVLSAPREMRVRVAGETYDVLVYPDLQVGGFSIEVPQLPGCFSQAETFKEARAMATEAIECHRGIAGETATDASGFLG